MLSLGVGVGIGVTSMWLVVETFPLLLLGGLGYLGFKALDNKVS